MIYNDEHAEAAATILASRYGNADATDAAIIYDVMGNICGYAKMLPNGRIDVVDVDRNLCMSGSHRICNSTSMFAALVAEYGQGYRYVAA